MLTRGACKTNDISNLIDAREASMRITFKTLLTMSTQDNAAVSKSDTSIFRDRRCKASATESDEQTIESMDAGGAAKHTYTEAITMTTPTHK